MSNPIKYSTGTESLALKKGNFYIGTGDVGKGPTSSTGYYNGISPPSGGYTIYLNKESNGPSIYTASNDAQLISLTNSIAGTSYTTANECLVYFAGQTDKMVLNRNYEGIVTNGLILNLDAGFTPSYPRSGTTWIDLSLSGNNGTLTNGPTFSSNDGGGSIVFDGVDDICSIQSVNLSNVNKVTITFWCKILNYKETPNTYNMLFEVSTNFNNSTTGFYIGFADDSTGFFNKTYPISVNLRGNIGYNISGFNKNLVNDLNWHHWTCIFDKSITGTQPQQTFLYIDGVYQNPTIIPTNFRSDNNNNFGNDTSYIGARSQSTTAPSNIQISTMLFYNRALSSTEILQNYNAQKGRFGL